MARRAKIRRWRERIQGFSRQSAPVRPSQVQPKPSRHHKAKLKKFILQFKTGKKCSMCSETHPACLSFHHKDPKTKLFCVAESPRLGLTIQQVMDEIAKCELICHNCHSKLHWNEDHPDRPQRHLDQCRKTQACSSKRTLAACWCKERQVLCVRCRRGRR